METRLDFDIRRQPDNTSCGPACLDGVYRYFGKDSSLETLLGEVEALEEGGTLGVYLGCHALRCGYSATIFSYNVQIFDPTWSDLDAEGLKVKLEAQRRAKPIAKLHRATDAYLEYLDRGGKISFEDFSGKIIQRFISKGTPIIAGLSATYLHKSPREYGPRCDSHDVRGEPVGHFVVLCGFDRKTRKVLVADPLFPNSLSETMSYEVGIDRLVGAIFLGVVTYDANLIVIEPAPGKEAR